MLYIVETAKDAETAMRDLEEAAKRNKFGVISLLDLRQKMKEKGVEFAHACKILEVCNPEQASRLERVGQHDDDGLGRVGDAQGEGKRIRC